MSALRSLFWCLREAPLAMTVSALLAVLATALQLVPFVVVYRAVVLVVQGGTTAVAAEFATLALIAALGVVGRYVAFGLSTAVAHVGAYRALARIRLRLAGRLGRMPAEAVGARRSGELKKVLIDDVEKLEAFLAHGVPDAVSALTVWLAVTGWLVVVDWRLGLATFAVVPVAFAAMSRAAAGGMRYAVDYGAATGRMNAAITELVTGLPTLRTFGRLGRELGEVERAVHRQGELAVGMSRVMVPWASGFYVLISASAVTVLPTAAWLYAAGTVDGVTVLFFAVLALGANAGLLQLFLLLSELGQLVASNAGVRALDAEPEQSEPEQAGSDRSAPRAGTRPRHHDVEFDAVRVRYGTREVLHGVSFTARAGQVTALVGASGAGKSTLGKLVTRAVDVADGAVRIGGVDVRDLGSGTLRETATLVVQDTFLFTGTIAENLRLARPDATDARLRAAAVAARVDEFVAPLPGGYDTLVGERGATVSGGQAQRISIARAILADTPVVVLDEATAFADPENEAAVQDALAPLLAGRTLIVIAHRLGTVVDADRIVVLDDGHAVEQGTHDELLAAAGVYARLWADWTAVAPEVPA